MPQTRIYLSIHVVLAYHHDSPQCHPLLQLQEYPHSVEINPHIFGSTSNQASVYFMLSVIKGVSSMVLEENK